MKFLRVFETEQERQSVVSQLEYNTVSLADGVLLLHTASGPGPAPVYDHYIGTINAEQQGRYKILAGGESGAWGWIPARVVVDGVELKELSDYIDLASGLHTIEIWDNPENSGYYTMYQDSGYFVECNYSSMIIPNYVTEIGESVFNSNCSLASVTIPGSVTHIGHTAFHNCMELTSITCNAINPPTLGDAVFYNTNNCPIYVPASSVDAYKVATGWSTYASRIQAIQS